MANNEVVKPVIILTAYERGNGDGGWIGRRESIIEQIRSEESEIRHAKETVVVLVG